MEYKVGRTAEYTKWLDSLSGKERIQVADRISRIQNDGHFGKIRYLDDGLWEIKFNNGNRVYFFRIAEKEIVLVLGGNKHGQQKDIQKAKTFFR